MKQGFLAVLLGAVLLACGGGQSAECKKSLECSEAVAPGSTANTTAAYGPDGSCWKSSGQAADECTRACKQVLESVKIANPNVAACQ
jgi:hypothetical protein